MYAGLSDMELQPTPYCRLLELRSVVYLWLAVLLCSKCNTETDFMIIIAGLICCGCGLLVGLFSLRQLGGSLHIRRCHAQTIRHTINFLLFSYYIFCMLVLFLIIC